MARKIGNGTLVEVSVPDDRGGEEENKAKKGRVRGYNKKRKEYAVTLPDEGKVQAHRSKVRLSH